MGAECECQLKFRGKTISGKAQLESDHLLFRGAERLKIMLKDITDVQSRDGILTLHFAGGPVAFELGPTADKWARKILNPPARLEKLGVKEGSLVSLVGILEETFLDELRTRKAELGSTKAKRDLVFFAADKAFDLKALPKLTTKLKPAGCLWVVYPKGVAAIREIQVLEAGRAALLKDVKVVGFSATHTALKFVILVASRKPSYQHPLEPSRRPSSR